MLHDKAVAEISRLEGQLINGIAVDEFRIEAVLETARERGDGGLEGRVLCLTARALVMQGRNEDARRTAAQALTVFEQLDAAHARRYAGLHAETFRAAGTALSKLGRVGEALEQLEAAVGVAQAGVDDPMLPDPPATLITAQSALMRSLMALGIALFFIGEIDAAIEAYGRAIETAEAYPVVYETFLDDALLSRWNLVEALHERARRRRAAGDGERAASDIAAAKRLIDDQRWRIEEWDALGPIDPGHGPDPRLGASRRAAYYGALAEHLLMTGEPAAAYAAFERRLAEIERIDYELGIATAQVGLAEAALALHWPRTALEHTDRALDVLDRDDESHTRAAVLLARATAHQDLGDYAPAFHALARHHQVRAELEAGVAQQYARRMTAKLGVERARADAESHRADAESHRRVAEMIATLGKIGQEITANLDADAIVRIFAQRITFLLGPVALVIWLVDASDKRLIPAWCSDDERAYNAVDIALDDRSSLAATVVREKSEKLSPTIPGEARHDLFAPLLVADRVLGVVAIQADQLGTFSEKAYSILRTLNTYVAIALDNAAAYTRLERTVAALQVTQAELARKTAEFERLSLTDALTGVANRRALTERGQIEIAALGREPSSLSVVIFDIDHFKRVNDTFGHGVGDIVLSHVALVAKENLRPGDLIARIGGEEFALLLPHTEVGEAQAIAERIRAKIAEAQVISGETAVSVTCSFGVAPFDNTSGTIDNAFQRADSALYLAKQAGRNKVLAAPAS